LEQFQQESMAFGSGDRKGVMRGGGRERE
jgi:hypothetical protein